MTDARKFFRAHKKALKPLFGLIDEARPGLTRRIREIAEIPAPTFQERRRTQYLLEQLPAMGLRDVHALPGGSVLGYARSRSEADTLLVAAHIDTVFPADTNLATRVDGHILHGPGTGDNAANVAAMIALVRLLREAGVRPARNVAFCGTVCEEGKGNLAGVGEVIDDLGGRLAEMIAVDGTCSSVVNRSLAIRRYVLTIRGPGGHSWSDFGNPSAVHEIARITSALASLPVPDNPKTTFNVGTIHGGTSINAIAEECEAEIDLRSIDKITATQLERSFLKLVADLPPDTVDTKARFIGERPAASLDPEHDLVQTAQSAAKQLGLKVGLGCSSTDAALPLSRGVPSICFGTYHGKGGHTLEEHIDLDSLTTGLKWLALTVLMRTGIEE
ncbi:MAG: M20/M25/M40 family metallo-hydrolase [Planctomycetota bacterium]|jgi:acetylornithine deacetylase/succinyl-diaminopimelate desuccinylase-like protein